jgi:phage terminase large subunit GpA-like protein
MVHPVGAFQLKKDVLSALSRTLSEEDQPGAVRYPLDADEAYFEQMTAETLVTRTSRSTRQARQIWLPKQGQPNEALDIAVYARAMAHLLGVFRSTPEQWKALFVERAMMPSHELPALEKLWLGMAPEKPDETPARASRKSKVLDAIRRHNERATGSDS